MSKGLDDAWTRANQAIEDIEARRRKDLEKQGIRVIGIMKDILPFAPGGHGVGATRQFDQLKRSTREERSSRSGADRLRDLDAEKE